MSLEDKIQENTQALNALRDIVKQLMGMLPPTGCAPVTEASEKKAPEATEASVKTSAAVPPKEEPKTEEAPADPAPQPAPSMEELRGSLKNNLMALYKKNAALGKTILDKFGVKNLSGLSDDQLPSFAKEVQAALQGV